MRLGRVILGLVVAVILTGSWSLTGCQGEGKGGGDTIPSPAVKPSSDGNRLDEQSEKLFLRVVLEEQDLRERIVERYQGRIQEVRKDKQQIQKIHEEMKREISRSWDEILARNRLDQKSWNLLAHRARRDREVIKKLHQAMGQEPTGEKG